MTTMRYLYYRAKARFSGLPQKGPQIYTATNQDERSDKSILMHKIKGLRITCLNETDKYVWIGTSSGMVLVILKMLDQNKNLDLPIKTIMLSDGHVGAVRFINTLYYSSRTEKNEMDELLISEQLTQNSFESFLIVSGGEGYHDYSRSLLHPDLDVKNADYMVFSSTVTYPSRNLETTSQGI
ncbi:hypothetical protein MXB_1202, partial [Myxobolus squamalis]